MKSRVKRTVSDTSQRARVLPEDFGESKAFPEYGTLFGHSGSIISDEQQVYLTVAV